MVGHLFTREERVPTIRTEEGARPRVAILVVAQVALAHEPLVAAGVRAGVRQPYVDGALVIGQPKARGEQAQTDRARETMPAAGIMFETLVALQVKLCGKGFPTPAASQCSGSMTCVNEIQDANKKLIRVIKVFLLITGTFCTFPSFFLR
jgi:hypothetical protein